MPRKDQKMNIKKIVALLILAFSELNGMQDNPKQIARFESRERRSAYREEQKKKSDRPRVIWEDLPHEMKESILYFLIKNSEPKSALQLLKKLESVDKELQSIIISSKELKKYIAKNLQSSDAQKLLIKSSNSNDTLFVEALLEMGAHSNDSVSAEALFNASKNNRKKITKLLLLAGVLEEAKEAKLLSAVLLREPKKVEALLIKGVSPNGCTKSGCTALMCAANNNDLAIAKLLIHNGADINAKNRAAREKSALMIAAENGNKKMVALLLKTGAIVDQENDYHGTALTCATEFGHKNIVKLLLANHADVTHCYSRGATALSIAASRGHLAIVRLLLDKDANVNAKDIDHTTPLMEAAAKGYTKIGQILIEHKADINAKSKINNTALLAASRNGDIELVKYLLSKGAEINVQESDNGYTSLVSALIGGHLEIAKLLLAYDAQVNTVDKDGRTPLMAATKACFPMFWIWSGIRRSFEATETHLLGLEIVKLLLVKGANVNAIDNKGCTPLMVVGQNGVRGKIAKKLARLFVEHGADINAHNEDGDAVLTIAAYKGLDKIVRVLIEHGADVNATDLFGNSVLMRALPKDTMHLLNCEIDNILLAINVLLSNGAHVNAVNKSSATALSLACGKDGKKEIVQFLLEHNADIDKQDNQGITPLMTAVLNNNIPVVTFLLERGANSNLKNLAGKTAIVLAAEAGNKEVLRLFLG